MPLSGAVSSSLIHLHLQNRNHRRATAIPHLLCFFMTGIEVAVLLPLVYGCVHLGKKVLEQGQVINNQIAVIDTQRETIAVLQSATGGVEGTASSGWSGSLQRIAAVSGVVIAASALAFNTHRWSRRSSHGGSEPQASPTVSAPHASYEPTFATSEQEACRICCEHQRDTLLLPCRHFALCWPCAWKILNGSLEKKCPLCRSDISSAQFTYVS